MPRRPNYFEGRLLTAQDFEAEQSYFLDGRRSDARRLHGSGVVCGLDVRPSDGGGVVVEPGVAIDGLGREIVVPDLREMPDPRQPIDARGEPCGERVESEVVTICLSYAERPEEGDPARFVRETYTLDVHPGPAEPSPASRAAEAALTGSAEAVAGALCEAAAREERDPLEPCVPIATVDLRKGGPHVVVCPRRVVAATDVLLELILGLVRRVQALEQRS